MCTAIRFDEKIFGRTLDFERSFGEEIVVTPRGKMRVGEANNRYAIMGVGIKNGGTPLYFDGINEWGLTIGALNFPGCAVYHNPSPGQTGVASAHLISLVLGFCRSVAEARNMLDKICITPDGADESTPPTPLHWMIADSRESIVAESVSEGLRVYDNPVGVLTNSPDFPYQLTRLADYSAVSAENPKTTLGGQPLYSRGMGGIGLPGDYSSASRFARVVFMNENTKKVKTDIGSVSRAFHILSAVSLPRGCVVTDEGAPVSTIYTVCADMEKPGYYLTTASCRTIRQIRLTDELIEADEIMTFPIYREEMILPLS